MVTVDDLRLERTSWACPEQYDVFVGEECVAYLRLRHGWFRADCPLGHTVYETEDVMGDGLFEPEERDEQIAKAKVAIVDELNRKAAK